MSFDYVRAIHNAEIYDLALETPVSSAQILSHRLSNKILLKREDLQPVFSFKVRGAYNKLKNLTREQMSRGVIAASAGNHAQGVAISAKKLKIHATIVMPVTTPLIKVDAVQAYGARVILYGDDYNSAAAHAEQLSEKEKSVFVHPFDDRDVIVGQGTIGMEIHRQISQPLDAIFIAVGGGGLCAGIAAYLSAMRPETKIIAVESDDAACLAAAIEAGHPVRLPEVGIFADGTAVAEIGNHTWDILKDLVHEVIAVTTDEICAAIKDTFNDTRAICEPSGAIGLAGLKKYILEKGVLNETLLAVQCGANIDFDRLRYISERTQTGEKREAIIAVTIKEQPGSFKNFCQSLKLRNITEFNYRYSSSEAAQIFVGVQVSGDPDRLELIQDLISQNYCVEDMTDNEMAKLHIRHMVGGRAPKVSEEQVYRFDFPERPGALLNFLNILGDRWNISLFHYRNHGSAFGRVLVALQALDNQRDEIGVFLDSLQYRYVVETHNNCYKLFLGNPD